MKILEVHEIIKEIITNHMISFEIYETHEKLRVSFENHENQENIKIPYKNYENHKLKNSTQDK